MFKVRQNMPTISGGRANIKHPKIPTTTSKKMMGRKTLAGIPAMFF
jgi:hypothetical protein